MKIYFIAISFCTLALYALPVFATQHTTTNTGINESTNIKPVLQNPFKCPERDCNLISFVKAVINDILLPIGGVIAVMAFIWSGFLFVTAQGNETKLATAKNALFYTAIGTAILLGAVVIANVIGATINALRTP